MKINNIIELGDFPFHHKIKTRWRDIDAFKHVNNATFLSYIEDARILFFKRWEINLKEKSLIVAAVKIDYIKQLEHPSNIIIGQKVSRLGTKSFDIQSAVFNEKKSELVCCSTITSVCYDFNQNKTVLIYDEIKNDYQNG
jgi:acyl-CoA thioester hydrolase